MLTFQNEGNYRHKETELLSQQEQISFKIRNANNVRGIFLNAGVTQRNLATLIKQCLFVSGVYGQFWVQIMKIKVAGINAPLN